MSTTIRDFGRNSERFGEIAFYYAFPIKFWFNQHMIQPEDVLTWCRENCTGYYKVVCYTHNTSVRNDEDPTVYDDRIIYVDKIYLQNEEDAAIIKLAFEVKDQQVKRPYKMKPRRKAKKTKKVL